MGKKRVWPGSLAKTMGVAILGGMDGRTPAVRGPKADGMGCIKVGVGTRVVFKQVLLDLEAWAETKRIQINVTEVKWVRKGVGL